jgi:predicted phage-related endonuclease
MNITNRTTHDVQQGTVPWLRLREGFFTASEAPAALGVGNYVSRAELLRQKHTGVSAEHSPATLGKFAAGHAAEAKARPLAEAIAEAELFPVTMSAEVDGLRLLASLDGLRLDDEVCWETKLWNEELAAHVIAGTLPEHYKVQMDQELLVSGASRCLFTCTDGTPENFVHCWYEASPERFRALLAGWRQFAADLAAYVPQPRAEKVEAEPMDSLPAVSVRLDGALSVTGNLPSFGQALKAFIARMPVKPATDTEFATCEAACKALKKAEDALDAAEAGALASITDVEAMRRAVADCRKLARDTRLAAEKMVERRKLEIKEEAVMRARRDLDTHIAVVNAEIAPMRLLPVQADFAGAIKGKRSLESMRDALDTTLAAAKIAADEAGRAIRKNLDHFKEVTNIGMESLFADLSQLVHKSADDFRALVQARVLAQQERDRKAEEARQAAEAQRIAAAEQRAREQEAARIAEQQRQQEAAAAEAQRRADAALQAAARITEGQHPQQVLKAEPATADATDRGTAANVSPRGGAMGAGQAAAAAPAGDEPATMKLGDICGRLGFTVTAAFVGDTLHVKPAKVEGNRPGLYTESQFGLICRQLQSHCSAMAELYGAEVAA